MFIPFYFKAPRTQRFVSGAGWNWGPQGKDLTGKREGDGEEGVAPGPGPGPEAGRSPPARPEAVLVLCRATTRHAATASLALTVDLRDRPRARLQEFCSSPS